MMQHANLQPLHANVEIYPDRLIYINQWRALNAVATAQKYIMLLKSHNGLWPNVVIMLQLCRISVLLLAQQSGHLH